jgi:hypothetical protein
MYIYLELKEHLMIYLQFNSLSRAANNFPNGSAQAHYRHLLGVSWRYNLVWFLDSFMVT